MADLTKKSSEEIQDLLDEYGIKHGPIVDSTRSLYEKKLREAMAKAKKPSDKTYYREEVQEEVTYVTRTPLNRMYAGNSEAYIRARSEPTETEYLHESYTSRPAASYKSSYPTPTPTPVPSENMKSPAASQAPKSSSFIPTWFKVVFFLVVLFLLYFVFFNMESNEPIKGIK